MKKILFLTGTRADFGKIKSLISILDNHQEFETFVFVTGMHMQKEYGYTLIEIERCNFKNVHAFENHTHETTMDLTLAKTIEGFSGYCKKINPDLNDYVTKKAISGLFVMVEKEENKIRVDPLARISDLLAKVFGSIKL